MKTCEIIVPYIGELDELSWISLEMLADAASQCTNIEVYISLIVDNPPGRIVPHSVRVYDFGETFNTNNRFLVELNRLYTNPYKLCDLKPILQEIFHPRGAISKCDYVGWADVDVIYSPKIFDAIQVDEDSTGHIYGRYGHLMIFDSVANKRVTDIFANLVDTRRYAEIFTSEKHFAVDEFKFLHRILENLEASEGMNWHSDWRIGNVHPFYSEFIIDGKSYEKFRHTEGCLQGVSGTDAALNGSEFDYIHIQKRKTEVAASVSSNVKADFWVNRERDGSVTISNDWKSSPTSKMDDLLFFFRAQVCRFKGRILNHGLQPRLHLRRSDLAVSIASTIYQAHE